MRPAEEDNKTARTSHPVLEMDEKEKSSLIFDELTTPREPINTLRMPNQASSTPLPRRYTSQIGANFWTTRSSMIFHQPMARETVTTQKWTGNRPSLTANPKESRKSNRKLPDRDRVRAIPEIRTIKEPQAWIRK
jgi:hypothetical protein